MYLKDIKHPFNYKIWFNWIPDKLELSNVENVSQINELMNRLANNYGFEYFVKPEFEHELDSKIDILKPKPKLECNGNKKCEGCNSCKKDYIDMNVRENFMNKWLERLVK